MNQSINQSINCECFVTSFLTMDRVIWHTAVHHSSTYTCTPNFNGIERTFCGWMYRWTGCIRSTSQSWP